MNVGVIEDHRYSHPLFSESEYGLANVIRHKIYLIIGYLKEIVVTSVSHTVTFCTKGHYVLEISGIVGHNVKLDYSSRFTLRRALKLEIVVIGRVKLNAEEVVILSLESFLIINTEDRRACVAVFNVRKAVLHIPAFVERTVVNKLIVVFLDFLILTVRARRISAGKDCEH